MVLNILTKRDLVVGEQDLRYSDSTPSGPGALLLLSRFMALATSSNEMGEVSGVLWLV